MPAPLRRDPPLLVETFRVVDPLLAVAVLLAQLLVVPAVLAGQPPFAGLSGSLPARDVMLVTAFAAWWYLSFVLLEMYGAHRIARASDELVAVIVASAVGAAPLLPYLGFARPELGLSTGVAVWLAAATMILTLRTVLRRLWLRRRPARARRVLVVGSGPRARQLVGDLARSRDADRVVGFLDSQEAAGKFDAPRLGEVADLETVLMTTAVDAVLIALPIKSCYADVQRTIETCERIGVVAEYPADVFRSELTHPRIDPWEDRPVVTIGAVPDEGGGRVKRALDVAGALSGILLLWPVMLLIAIAIRLTSEGPVLFVQQRCGRNRRGFSMYKFRTMVCNAEVLQPQLEHLNEALGPVFKIRLDPRITPLGRFLRRTSLDELPQLFNVLRGDMSLVGPRPLPLRDVRRFSAATALRRFSVRPGITCLWQVNGRSTVPFEDWMDLDLQYIDRWSLLLDLRILLRTVPAVFRGEGAA